VSPRLLFIVKNCTHRTKVGRGGELVLTRGGSGVIRKTCLVQRLVPGRRIRSEKRSFSPSCLPPFFPHVYAFFSYTHFLFLSRTLLLSFSLTLLSFSFSFVLSSTFHLTPLPLSHNLSSLFVELTLPLCSLPFLSYTLSFPSLVLSLPHPEFVGGTVKELERRKPSSSRFGRLS